MTTINFQKWLESVQYTPGGPEALKEAIVKEIKNYMRRNGIQSMTLKSMPKIELEKGISVFSYDVDASSSNIDIDCSNVSDDIELKQLVYNISLTVARRLGWDIIWEGGDKFVIVGRNYIAIPKPNIAFHLAATSTIAEIKRRGILPSSYSRSPDPQKQFFGHTKNRIFLFTREKTAYSWALGFRKPEGGYTLITVDMKKVPVKNVYYDHKGGIDAVFIQGTKIPPEALIDFEEIHWAEVIDNEN